VWKRSIDGRVLTFHLAGINNQNFLMRDEETGSFWQQISGKAIFGPLRGRTLEPIHSDELTFALWRRENPSGAVLKPVSEYVSEYESNDWEKRMQKRRAVVDTAQTSRPPRDLMLGVQYNNAARAYVLDRVLQAKLIQDWIGGTPVIVLVGPDGKSVRVFKAQIAGHEGVPEFYRDTDIPKDADPPILTDSITGSRWTFEGCALSGPAARQCLQPLSALKDYWFDWRLYHPDTTVYD
jgi:hypothetical protein